MMGVLAAMGSGFDCASQGEIEMVTSLGEFDGMKAWQGCWGEGAGGSPFLSSVQIGSLPAA